MRVSERAEGPESEGRLVPPRAVLGRGGPGVWWARPQAYASKLHAALEWTGDRWTLRDLGSRNGTFLNGARLEDQRQPLTPGDRIGLGEPDAAPVYVWDVEPPGPTAQTGDGTVVVGEGAMLVLPDPKAPALTVFEIAGIWWTETADGERARLPEDGSILVAGADFRVSLPLAPELTPHVDVALDLAHASVTFHVSQDEERVVLVVERLRRRAELASREHVYLLLLLARARLADGEGWVEVETLCRQLRVDPTTLNVLVYRARKQLAAAGVVGAPGIVEVRRGARRLGVARCSEMVLEE